MTLIQFVVKWGGQQREREEASAELKFLLVPSYLLLCCCFWYQFNSIKAPSSDSLRSSLRYFYPTQNNKCWADLELWNVHTRCSRASEWNSNDNDGRSDMMKIIQFYKYKRSPLIYLDLFDAKSERGTCECSNAIFVWFASVGDWCASFSASAASHTRSYSFRCTSSPCSGCLETRQDYIGQFIRARCNEREWADFKVRKLKIGERAHGEVDICDVSSRMTS